jgi:hypothetical protein
MAALPTADFPRSSAGSARAGRRRFAAGLHGNGISHASTDGSQLKNAGQAVAVLKARCGDHPHRFDFSSERTFGLAGFCTLRTLTGRHGEAADLRILIADLNQLGVLACLTFLLR